MRKIITILFTSLIFTSCLPDKFKEEAGKKFGDQHFKTAIALIELHKVREGVYPSSLKELKYTGDWDNFIYQAVEYKKLDDGYELNLVNNPLVENENLDYPDDFWKGLGIKKSNIKNKL
ncbi:hypothetical protein [Flavobacterium luminosum]|uniref:Lipoprotein n=1 Tax=Flavobacterium luminosum TaxID=2949086 RepID=A0ABT0TQK9_9FLAO|nr:hypothetical protein [Flavobacterium sp. HXWNR70]MCL9809787.1 hypothetical protein [Flavobacterium sp. HXWNR70]